VSRLNQAQRLSAISMIVVAVGAFLPWASVFGISISGINGDGQFTLIAATAGLVLLGMSAGVLPIHANRTLMLIVLGIGAALSTLVGIADMTGVAAIGIYMTLFGGIAWGVGVIWDIRLGRAEATVDALTAPAPPLPPQPPQQTMRCPDCAEAVEASAQTCTYCGATLHPPSSDPELAVAVEPPS